MKGMKKKKKEKVDLRTKLSEEEDGKKGGKNKLMGGCGEDKKETRRKKGMEKIMKRKIKKLKDKIQGGKRLQEGRKE